MDSNLIEAKDISKMKGDELVIEKLRLFKKIKVINEDSPLNKI